MTEGRDWTRSQFEQCPDCGVDASLIADDQLGPAILRAVAAWGRTLAGADPALLRVRPEPATWSAIEYACHVRDLLPVMEERIRLLRHENDPELGWWDHEAAVLEDRYAEQDPVLVQETMSANARSFAGCLGAVGDDEWDRAAERRPGEVFTIRGMGRFVLHEVSHHREDADRSMRTAGSDTEDAAHG